MIHIGAITDIGFVEAAAVLRAIIVVGSNWNDVVLSTISIHISSDARSGVGFDLSSSVMAFIPIGVAALPMPKMFAVMFMDMYFFASGGADGKRRFINGFNSFSIFSAIPDFSATFNIPVQKHITPANDKTVSTDAFAPSNAAFTVASRLPFTAAVISEKIIIAHQI